jgi:hypothetical protein
LPRLFTIIPSIALFPHHPQCFHLISNEASSKKKNLESKNYANSENFIDFKFVRKFSFSSAMRKCKKLFLLKKFLCYA